MLREELKIFDRVYSFLGFRQSFVSVLRAVHYLNLPSVPSVVGEIVLVGNDLLPLLNFTGFVSCGRSVVVYNDQELRAVRLFVCEQDDSHSFSKRFGMSAVWYGLKESPCKTPSV